MRESFCAHLRDRGYADPTIRQHEQRLLFFVQRAARAGCKFSDLNHEALLALLRRLRPADKVLGRGFIRVWLRYRNPAKRPKITPWQPLVDEFLDFRANHQGICQYTLARESRIVRKFLTWQFGKQACDWPKVTVRDIWRYSEESTHMYVPSVANKRLSTLRSLLRFVHLRGACPVALANAVTCRASYGFQQRAPEILTEEQRSRLLESFDCDNREGCRDFAMALCMVDLGLRSGEVVQLKLTDLNWVEGSVTVPGIKAHPERTLPLVPRLCSALKKYIDQFRPQCASDRVFVRHPRFVGMPLDRSAVAHAMQCAYRRCGFPESWSGAHRLRHTFASRLYSSGAPVKEVADMLGHRSLDSTHRYTQVDFEGLRQVAQPWPV
jgi:site-specific recombinase XerD